MSAIEPVDNIAPETLSRFDAIIDVRSPAEFAEDHIPGAINLPVLSNEERAEVGTIYKQQSTFGARRIGAAYVSRNVAGHLEAFFTKQPPSSQFLVYCWRGGMRSGSMATIMSQVGWRTSVLQGGYKTWRRAVVSGLRNDETQVNIVLLDGQTGVAKSETLNRVAALGAQVLDLENLAAHRGSVFGAYVDAPQPTQKAFESQLWNEMACLDLTKPVLVEAESNRIGRCEVPKRLWNSMRAAPVIVIEANPELRTEYLVNTYRDIVEDSDAILIALGRLAPFHAKATIDCWKALANAGDFSQLAGALIRQHYDPLYDRARKQRSHQPIAKIKLASLDDASLDAAALEIKSFLSSSLRETIASKA
ncbi:MAG: tRNA 2-selenouridine(34) synthase MnmH [Pseudomonadota bacterium]